MSIPGLGQVAPAATFLAPTVTASTVVHELQANSEWRFEVAYGQSIEVRVLSGAAEIFGTELALNHTYTFRGIKSSIFTWHGCRIEVTGVCEEYTAEETPMVSYVNTHFALEKLRDEAAQNQGEAPRALVVGPNNAGKTSLVKLLTSYATRMGRQPMVVNTDSREGVLSIPGSLTATPFASIIDVEQGWGSSPTSGPSPVPVKLPLCYYYGLPSPEDNTKLFKPVITRLALAAANRLADDPIIKETGMLIDTPGVISQGKGGYDLISHIVSEFSVNTILVLGSERLYSEMVRRFSAYRTGSGSPITLVKLDKSGGCVDRDDAFMRQSQEAAIREYFFGDLKKNLEPSDTTDGVMMSSFLPGGEEEGAEATIFELVEPSSMMLHCIFAVMYASLRDSQETIRDANVMGFVYVAEVDEKKRRLKILAPLNTRITDRPMIWGSWPETTRPISKTSNDKEDDSQSTKNSKIVAFISPEKSAKKARIEPKKPKALSKTANVVKPCLKPSTTLAKGRSKAHKSETSSASDDEAIVQEPFQKWEVEGQYKITLAETIPIGDWVKRTIDATGFIMKLFFYRATKPWQLYAEFSCDKLHGIMRLCPTKTSHHDDLEDFEEACNLDFEEQPGPGTDSKWSMRWRGKDGGLRGDELVGGEINFNNFFNFDHDPSSPSNGFKPIEIIFMMMYAGNPMRFEAVKEADLAEGEWAEAPWKVKQRWEDLLDPEWLELPPVFPEDCETSSSLQAAESKKSKSPAATAIPQVVENRSPTFALAPAPAKSSNRKYIEEMPDWAWNVRGVWKISCPQLRKHLGIEETEENTKNFMMINMCNNPSHTNIGRQMWAQFYFLGIKFIGTMRFCPASPSERGLLFQQECTLKEFEEACELEHGFWPGPAPRGQQKFHMRWRGLLQGEDHSHYDDKNQTQVEFQKGENGKFKLKGVLMLDSTPLAFEAVQTATSQRDGYERKPAITQNISRMKAATIHEEGLRLRDACDIKTNIVAIMIRVMHTMKSTPNVTPTPIPILAPLERPLDVGIAVAREELVELVLAEELRLEVVDDEEELELDGEDVGVEVKAELRD
ncbi:hypothetical protein G7Y89_g6210 [Cudoniella acicularis]|uniref:Polynucleotide 5'-hydroxyl-kinase GRC3 n=1 Tax=Cudoniella acicularis TaxID=354080 RepID=A0A8H4RN75_9HELO|nr:hypothetical protein G7Y89_g6210 [Cudoniella acicularis]